MRTRVLATHPLGLTWVADDQLLRASHALAHEGRVWLIDPVDVPDAVERAVALGEPVAVLQLFMAHGRDGRAIAARLGVPLWVLPDEIPDSPLRVIGLDRLRVWRERALWWEDMRGLVVPEAIGTAEHFAVGSGPAGVHIMRRALPPNELRGLEPEHLLVGHGEPIHGPAAAAALHEALSHSRRDIPRLALSAPRIVRGIRARS
jgi:hypothetical protein